MSKTNVQIVEEFVEQVLNQQHFERAFEYCTEDCILHSTPFVGLGISTDERAGEKIVLGEVAPNSPAAGNLQAGDEIVRVSDGARTWETFNELKNGMWGRGVIGTPITCTVIRAGQRMDISLKRGRVDAFDMVLSNTLDAWRDDVLKNWPDCKTDIKLIFGDGDKVAYFAVYSGTNQEFHRSAVWGDITICRLKEGKIVESWGLWDELSQIKQLGYQVSAPVMEPVA